MYVPDGIKTNSIPREFRKTFSEAEIEAGDRVLNVKIMKNRMNNFPNPF